MGLQEHITPKPDPVPLGTFFHFFLSFFWWYYLISVWHGEIMHYVVIELLLSLANPLSNHLSFALFINNTAAECIPFFKSCSMCLIFHVFLPDWSADMFFTSPWDLEIGVLWRFFINNDENVWFTSQVLGLFQGKIPSKCPFLGYLTTEMIWLDFAAYISVWVIQMFKTSL